MKLGGWSERYINNFGDSLYFNSSNYYNFSSNDQEFKEMKSRFYKANDHGKLLQVTTELGKDNVMIGIADKELNWNDIQLNEEQSKAFKDFMRENDI